MSALRDVRSRAEKATLPDSVERAIEGLEVRASRGRAFVYGQTALRDAISPLVDSLNRATWLLAEIRAEFPKDYLDSHSLTARIDKHLEETKP